MSLTINPLHTHTLNAVDQRPIPENKISKEKQEKDHCITIVVLSILAGLAVVTAVTALAVYAPNVFIGLAVVGVAMAALTIFFCVGFAYGSGDYGRPQQPQKLWGFMH